MSATRTPTFHPHMTLLTDLHTVWDVSEPFLRSYDLIDRLIQENPTCWDTGSAYGRALTAQRMGRLLSQMRINAIKNGQDQRGYVRQHFLTAWRQAGITNLEGQTK